MHTESRIRGRYVEGGDDGGKDVGKDCGGINALKEDGSARVGQVLNLQAELGIGNTRMTGVGPKLR